MALISHLIRRVEKKLHVVFPSDQRSQHFTSHVLRRSYFRRNFPHIFILLTSLLEHLNKVDGNKKVLLLQNSEDKPWFGSNHAETLQED